MERDEAVISPRLQTSNRAGVKSYEGGAGDMPSLVVSMMTWCVQRGFQKMVSGIYYRVTHGTNSRTYITVLHPPGKSFIFTLFPEI